MYLEQSQHLRRSFFAKIVNDTHREKLCFTQFSKIIYSNKLTASNFLHMFTQSIRLYKGEGGILRHSAKKIAKSAA